MVRNLLMAGCYFELCYVPLQLTGGANLQTRREESRMLLPYALVPNKVKEADYRDLRPNLYATLEEELKQHLMFQEGRCYHYNCISPSNRDWRHTHPSGRFELLGKRVKIWPDYEVPICYKFQEGGATCKEDCLCGQSKKLEYCSTTTSTLYV